QALRRAHAAHCQSRRASRGAIRHIAGFQSLRQMNQRAWLASHVADEFRHRWLYQKSPANPLRLLQAVSIRYQKPELFDDQTTANQERELRQIAAHMGCEIVKVYKDHGISGAKGRNGRPDFDSLCKAAARREFDMVMAWSVDWLGRSLQDLVGFLSELHALGIDLFFHQQGLDTTNPTRKAMFPM